MCEQLNWRYNKGKESSIINVSGWVDSGNVNLTHVFVRIAYFGGEKGVKSREGLRDEFRLSTFECTVFVEHQEIFGRQLYCPRRETHSRDRYLSHQHKGRKASKKSCAKMKSTGTENKIKAEETPWEYHYLRDK